MNALENRTFRTRRGAISLILCLPVFLFVVFMKMNWEDGGSLSDLAITIALILSAIGGFAYGLIMLTISIELGQDAMTYRRAGRAWTIPYASIQNWTYTLEHALLHIENPVKKVHVYLIKDVDDLLRELDRRVGYRGEVR